MAIDEVTHFQEIILLKYILYPNSSSENHILKGLHKSIFAYSGVTKQYRGNMMI